MKDLHQFYDALFEPIAERMGSLDADTIVSIIGFDAGGPLNLCTVGYGKQAFVTYVSCELALRDDQRIGDDGPYELMVVCNDEDWARNVLTGIARLGLEAQLAGGHTIDISALVGRGSAIQGAVLEEFASVKIRRRHYRILLVHGVSGHELARARDQGAVAWLKARRAASAYPQTSVR